MGRRWRGLVVIGALLMVAGESGQALAQEPVGRLAGRVRRGVSGAQGIPVMLCELVLVNAKARGAEVKWDGCETTRDALTDAEGRYEFAALTPGGYAILARNQESWSYNGSSVHPGSSYVRLNESYHLWIATYRVKDGGLATADDILLIDTLELIEPVDHAPVESDNPTLHWEAVPLAAYYEVSLYTISSFVQPADKYLADTVNPVLSWVRADSTSLTVGKALTRCDYAWEVRALDAAGNKLAQSEGPHKPHSYFKVSQAANCE